MVPRQAARGHSFKGAGAYYLHDKKATTSERVEFTHTENVPTKDPDKALKWMAWTAIHAEELKHEAGVKTTGRKSEKPVFSFSLSWHPDEEPEQWQMIVAGRQALSALDLEEHETVMVGHSDREHPHLHLIVNLIHPQTGRAHSLSHSKLKLSSWAQKYEEENGRIYCKERVENNKKRERGEFARNKERESYIQERVSALYFASDSGKAFRSALAEEGLTLARGKRLVILDEDGKIYSLSRQIEGARAKDIKEKLADIDVPDLDRALGKTTSEAGEKNPRSDREKKPKEHKPEREEYFDRDRQDREWQESIIDAGIAHDEAKRRPQPPKSRAAPSPQALNRLQDRHLAEKGLFYEKNNRARLRLDAMLDEQYGEHERTVRREAEHLQNILGNSGRLRLGVLKFLGRIPKEPENDLENIAADAGQHRDAEE